MSEIHPQATFVLLTYNQEDYVRQAVEAALCQDYTNLEIIVSDDCSTDNTFETVREVASSYIGNHKLVINRTTSNLGISAHINEVMKLVSSDFVVAAAGDDISKPCRVSNLVAAWMTDPKKNLFVYSHANEILPDGTPTRRIRQHGVGDHLNDLSKHAAGCHSVLGATEAWDMALIRQFRPLINGLTNEDVIFPARCALLAGNSVLVASALVDYRVNVGISHKIARTAADRERTVPVEVWRREYYIFLQKTRDFRDHGKLMDYKRSISRCRAISLFKIYIAKKKRLTLKQIVFFCRLVPVRVLLRGILIQKFRYIAKFAF